MPSLSTYYKRPASKREKWLIPLWIALFLCQGAGAAMAAPRVIVSIAPLHSLTAGVMEGIGEPELLLNGQQDPHDFALRPSQMQALSQADIIFIAGNDMEHSLEQPLAALKAPVIALGEAPGIELISYPEEEEGKDLHFWLSPDNARKAVAVIAERLGTQDAAHAADYARNAKRLDAEIAALDKELASSLKSAASGKGPFIIAYHEAYNYFERHFALPPTIPLARYPELSLSAADAKVLEKTLLGKKPACIFGEAGHESPMLKRLAESTGAEIRLLNPEGSGYDAGKSAYFAMMRDIGRHYAECLKP